MPAFLEKLKQKQQPANLIKQASHALSLYYAMQASTQQNNNNSTPESRQLSRPQSIIRLSPFPSLPVPFLYYQKIPKNQGLWFPASMQQKAHQISATDS